MFPGLCQETCRDLGHTSLGTAAAINTAEAAYVQGHELLYDFYQDRLIAALNFTATFLNGTAPPSDLCSGTLTSVTLPTPTFEIAYNQYALRVGQASLLQSVSDILV